MPRATELMKVVPTLVVPAEYVGLFSIGGGQIEARTFDGDGAELAVVGTWTPSFIPNSGPPDIQAVFLRGGTAGSLAGCSWAFIEGVADPVLYVLDLEAADLVAVATTHRPALGGGQSIAASVAVVGSFVYECGARLDSDADEQMVGYLRRISQDGQTIAAISASFNLFHDGQTRSPGAPLMIEDDRWAVPTLSTEEFPTNPGYVDTVTVAGAIGQIADREVPASVFGALPLGETSGSPLTRVALVGNEYVKQDLFDIGGFTATGAGTLRDGRVVAFTASTGATRLCTFSGSHPITTGTAGPTIQFDTELHGLIALDGL